MSQDDYMVVVLLWLRCISHVRRLGRDRCLVCRGSLGRPAHHTVTAHRTLPHTHVNLYLLFWLHVGMSIMPADFEFLKRAATGCQ